MHYDEDNICQKCGKTIPSDIIEYNNAHDGGFYEESYRKVNRNFAKRVGLGFYCNKCLSKIGDSKVSEIIQEANNYLNKDLQEAIDEVKQHYEKKMKQLHEIKEYVEYGLNFLDGKSSLSELSLDKLNYLLKGSHIYQPNYQKIEVGFSPYSLKEEVRELYNTKI